MCGRYALVLRPPTLRRRLREYGLPLDSSNEEDPEGIRQSYNIAPGYIEPVYRAIVPRDGDNPGPEDQDEDQGNEKAPQGNQVVYILQGMKWGLVPSWTKYNPDYRSIMKTINCRDDSLLHNSGMWNSMKKKKRCVVLAEGFYEWQKKGKEKIPHYIKRKDGNLMYMAGLWDCVTLPDSDTGQPMRSYTYTIITVPASSQMEFLHDRMPALLTTPEEILTWLDPATTTWTPELQRLLHPFLGTLEIYPVPKEVGKVGNNDKSFVLPRNSEENKSNIKNWFAEKGTKKIAIETEGVEVNADRDEHKDQTEPDEGNEKRHEKNPKREIDESKTKDCVLLPGTEEVPEAKETTVTVSRKRSLAKASPSEEQEVPHSKWQRRAISPIHSLKTVESASKPQHKFRSPTSNNRPAGKGAGNQPSKKKATGGGSMKITNFFPK
ncbi:DUF159-domain-containing protein [Terfezia boudieri ATCC MYA-4762]|uniref:DUF159-domain-containing protein n=1 Tax=Terfezia boudieri ATCC MYA-4762 TaxID=1051890 RepID=A0A3N4LHX4_9PEZI|nr:DUF159-domain-containing protein [Terfezia boudieri ATCC MYA-4762]